MTAPAFNMDLDPFSPEIKQDPYPFYASLLSCGVPVYLRRRNIWILTDYEDVRAATIDAERFSSAEGIAYDRSKLPILFGVDPPDHTRLRRLINRDFTPRAVESWRPLVERICAELIDEALEQETVEIVAQSLVPLPVRVISAILGIDDEDVPQFKRWSSGVIEGFNANARLITDSGEPGAASPGDRRDAAKKAMTAVSNITVYFNHLLESRRRHPSGDDLISKLLVADDGEYLRDSELVWLCLALLVGGNETTTHLLGNLCVALIEHPDQYQLVRENPELQQAAIEETLRYDPPVQSVFRTTTADVEFGGVQIPRGSRVQLSFAAANRDPRRWPDPGRFSVRRAAEGHLSFGAGIHFCVGAPLVRIEAATFLRNLLTRTKGMELAGDFTRIDSQTFRGVERMPLRFIPVP